jgi:hypothetical protein
MAGMYISDPFNVSEKREANNTIAKKPAVATVTVSAITIKPQVKTGVAAPGLALRSADRILP